MVDLYGQDQDRFYQLASFGVSADAPPWAKEIAELAAMVRHFVRFGFRLDGGGKQIIGTDNALYLGDTEFEVALDFLQGLSGVVGHNAAGRDYSGTEVSPAEVWFSIGSPDEYGRDKTQICRPQRDQTSAIDCRSSRH